jgi:carboxyl-terminal processing protease
MMLRLAPCTLLRLLVALVVAAGVALSLVDVRAQTPAETGAVSPPTEPEKLAAAIEKLLDAVVEGTFQRFWDRERVSAWKAKAAEARQAILDAPSLEEAARRINHLLDTLNSSHVGLLTPDDPDYYVFGSVFGHKGRLPGIGIFSRRIDGRDLVDLVLEGFPADRAGLKVGDEIVSVDGAPYHPVRSFRGKAGREAAVALRRVADGPVETVAVAVEDIAPLAAFNAATVASARVIERAGRRVAYVHVWASLGASEDALRAALERVGFKALDPGRPLVPPLAVDGLIVDMRGKIGGMLTTVVRYLELIGPRGPQIVGDIAGVKRTLAKASMRGRTAVLIDWHTRSAAEIFAHAFKRERLGLLIGTRTAGAVTSATLLDLPGGNRLYMGTMGLTVDGVVLEGLGVAPDIEVARSLPYAGGADPVLDRAVAHLVDKAAEPRG